MMKKEEAKEKEGGENSVKQDGKELEPRWRSRKNERIPRVKVSCCRKWRLIWGYFFATYLNYLKDRFLF